MFYKTNKIGWRKPLAGRELFFLRQSADGFDRLAGSIILMNDKYHIKTTRPLRNSLGEL